MSDTTLGKASAGRPLSVLRGEGDSSCRIGSEECLMPGSDTDAAGATKLAWRIRHAHTGTPVPACDRSLPATVSVGFTVREANHSAPAQTLLERASQALTPSKAASRNRVPMTTQRHHPPDRPSTCPLRTIPV